MTTMGSDPCAHGREAPEHEPIERFARLGIHVSEVRHAGSERHSSSRGSGATFNSRCQTASRTTNDARSSKTS